jgi:hypothetical protein
VLDHERLVVETPTVSEVAAVKGLQEHPAVFRQKLILSICTITEEKITSPIMPQLDC